MYVIVQMESAQRSNNARDRSNWRALNVQTVRGSVQTRALNVQKINTTVQTVWITVQSTQVNVQRITLTAQSNHDKPTKKTRSSFNF